MTAEARTRRVFLSHAYADTDRAEKVSAALRAVGVTVTSEPVMAEDVREVQDHLRSAIQASDVMVVLLSSSAAQSRWVRWELAQATSGEFRQKGIDVIPVLLDAAPIPNELFSGPMLDLAANFDKGLAKLVQQVDTATRVDFRRLTPESFEHLVADLLMALGLKVEARPGHSGIDLRASRQVLDPFGRPETETWLVECKLYSQSRISVAAIRQMVGWLATASATTRGLLVSTTQVTSVAQKYLDDLERGSRMRLRVLDGIELAALLREHADLADRYFPRWDRQE